VTTQTNGRMCFPQGPVRRRPEECGVMILTVLFLVLVLAGLASSMLTEVKGERLSIDRHETSMEALHAAELGLAKSELELYALKDAGSDGVGVVSGQVVASGFQTAVFTAASAPSPISDDRWIVTARGTKGHSVRKVEIGVRRRAGGHFMEGMFARDDLTIGGSVATDSYDSRTGTYASQASNFDAKGPYANTKGHVGSNEIILLHGSAVHIRGNAIPGYGRELLTTGSPVILGDSLPRTAPVDVPDPTLAEFTSAMTTNNNAEVVAQAATSGHIRYNASAGTLSVRSSATLTLTGGTYFFSELTLSASSKLVVTGPSKIYVTGDLDLGGGGVVNAAGDAPDLSFIVHPYPLPSGSTPSGTQVKIHGGPTFNGTVYAPGVDVKLNGGTEYFGAVVGKSIDTVGSVRFHYDEALSEGTGRGTILLERLYWRDLDPPLR